MLHIKLGPRTFRPHTRSTKEACFSARPRSVDNLILSFLLFSTFHLSLPLYSQQNRPTSILSGNERKHVQTKFQLIKSEWLEWRSKLRRTVCVDSSELFVETAVVVQVLINYWHFFLVRNSNGLGFILIGLLACFPRAKPVKTGCERTIIPFGLHVTRSIANAHSPITEANHGFAFGRHHKNIWHTPRVPLYIWETVEWLMFGFEWGFINNCWIDTSAASLLQWTSQPIQCHSRESYLPVQKKMFTLLPEFMW